MFGVLVVTCVTLGIAVLILSAILKESTADYRILANTIDADEQNVLATLEKHGWRIGRSEGVWEINGERNASILTAYRRACKIQQAREEADRAS